MAACITSPTSSVTDKYGEKVQCRSRPRCTDMSGGVVPVRLSAERSVQFTPKVPHMQFLVVTRRDTERFYETDFAPRLADEADRARALYAAGFTPDLASR